MLSTLLYKLADKLEHVQEKVVKLTYKGKGLDSFKFYYEYLDSDPKRGKR